MNSQNKIRIDGRTNLELRPMEMESIPWLIQTVPSPYPLAKQKCFAPPAYKKVYLLFLSGKIKGGSPRNIPCYLGRLHQEAHEKILAEVDRKKFQG